MGLLKKMASVLVTASLLFGLVGTAFATTPSEIQASAARMQELGIVVGDASGDMKLGDPITRAQLMKIMVWAFGQKDNAAILKGALAFPDTPNHWASGEIAIAKNIIVEKNHFEMGMPDGTFAPEGKVTAAQAVAFLMKFIGISPDSSKTWPNNYLDAAVSSGMISADVASSISATANSEATRGLVFYLADTAFASYPIASGKTVYTTYAKPVAPVLTLETPVLNTTDSKVTVTGTVSADAKSVFLGTTANPLTVSAGNFSFDVNLNMGANEITVGATDVVGQTSTKTLTVTRTVGVAAAIDAAATLTVAAGATVDLPVAVKDAQGNVITGAAVSTEGAIGTWADGKFTAANTVGTGEFTITSGELSAKVAVTVTPAALDTIAITGTADTFAVGSAQKFTASGKDAFGNAVELTNVTWTAVGGVIDNQGNFVASTSGNVVINASASDKTGSLTAVAYGKAVALRLSTPANVVANGVSETVVTATAVDANGNTDLGFTGTASFSSNNTGVATIDDDTKSVAFTNGIASATVVAGTSVGASTISVSVSGMTSATAIVKTDKQVLTSFTSWVDPVTIAADGTSAATVYVKALDQAGVRMVATTSLDIEETTSNSGVAAAPSLSSNTYDSSHKYHYSGAVSNAGSSGSTTFGFTITTTAYKTLTIPSVTLSSTTVGKAYKLGMDPIADATVGDTVKAVVRIYDYNGNQTTGLGDTTVTIWDVDANEQIATNHASYGKVSVSFTLTESGTYNLEARSAGLVKTTGSVTFNPGDAAQVDITAAPSFLNANGTSTSTLKATIIDAYGNKVTTGSYSVKFSKTAGSPSATQDFADTTVTTVDGVATAVITASLANPGSDTFKATVTGLVSDTIAISSGIVGTPAKLVVSTAGANKIVGTDTKVVVDVRDASAADGGNGVLVSSDNGRVVTLTVKDSDLAVVNTLTANTVNGKATFYFTQTTADDYTYRATAEGLEKSASNTVTFDAGKAVGFKVSPTLTTIGADGASTTSLRVYLVDEYGNTTANDTSTKVNFATSNAAVGVINLASKTYASGISASGTGSDFMLTSTAQPGTVTVTATDPDGVLTSHSASITTTTVGDAVRLSISVSGDGISTGTGAAAADRSYSIVTVQAVDASGNRVTSKTDGTVRLTLTTTADTVPTMGNIKVYGSSTAGSGLTAASGTNAFDLTFTQGQAKFYVTNTKAETLKYAAASTGFTTVNSSATFVAGDADHIVFATAGDAYILGNGTDVTVLKLEVQDANNNVVTGFSGTANFKLYSGNDYATLLNTSADFINGEAILSIQSKAVTDNATLTIYGWSATKNDAGAYIFANHDEDSKLSDSQIKVDGKAPGTVGTVTVAGSTSSTTNVRTKSKQPEFTIASPTDAGVGLDKALFQYKRSSSNIWSDLSEEDLKVAGPYTADWTDVGDLADGTYNFRVTVYDLAGNTLTSSTYTRVIDTVVGAVTGVTASDADATGAVTGLDFTINWTASTDATVGGQAVYIVAKDTVLDTTVHMFMEVIGDATTHTWTGTDLMVNDSEGNPLAAGDYDVYVVTVDDLGNKAASAKFTVTVVDDTP